MNSGAKYNQQIDKAIITEMDSSAEPIGSKHASPVSGFQVFCTENGQKAKHI